MSRSLEGVVISYFPVHHQEVRGNSWVFFQICSACQYGDTNAGPFSAAGATIMSGLLSQCLDYFLDSGSEHMPELYRLAHEDTAEADETLMH